MTRPNLDEIIGQIRSETPDPVVADGAIVRVRSKVFAAAADPAIATLRACADFQALLRPYLTQSLSEARLMLLEDHLHSCVDCRRALAASRGGRVRTMPRPQTVPRELARYTKWAAAAAIAVTVGLSSWGIVHMMPAPGARATVQSVSGTLYAVFDQSSAPIFSGRQVYDAQHIRTAKDSTALLRLNDGSLVEMNERAEISISKNPGGATIRLDGGNVIVQAAKQKSGALYVRTPDCLVTVHGTVFAVDRGVKGTRVSVAQGEVKVEEGGRSELLHPGDQTATNPSIEKTALPGEFEWSRNSAQYLALLGEFSTIQKGLEETPGPALRYGSKLLDQVPYNTVIYAAIPNLGNTLAEAGRLFNERIEQSDVLREWWTTHQPKGPNSIDDIVGRLRTFSSYLGDEIVLSIAADRDGNYSGPLLLAEVTQPGLEDFLKAQPVSRAFVVNIKNNILAIGTSDSMAAFTYPNRRTFANTYFQQVISKSYDSGVGWLFCADLEHILRNSVLHKEGNPTGLQDVRYLIYERKEIAGRTDNRVALNFRAARRGFAAWLGNPGPMGALDFVSPNALLAAGFVLRNPQALLGDVFNYAESRNSSFTGQLASFEQRSGINVLNDLAGPLGTDAAFAIDGPIFPVPNWEFAIECYSPDRLEWSIEKLIDDLNRENPNAKLILAKEPSDGRTFYTLTGANMKVDAHYAFADSYFLAAATKGMLLRAIQNRQNGYTLARSQKFQALLPYDSHSSFSGLVYHNLGALVGPIAEQLKSVGAVTPAQRASIEALASNSGPGLIFAYGEPNRIVISGTGPLFGLSLQDLAVPNIIADVIHNGPHRAR